MTRFLMGVAVLFSAVAQAQDAKPDPAKPDAAKPATAGDALHPRVKLETSLGAFVLELDAEKAPITVDNFIRYAEDKFYDGLIFHRVMKNFMIQGGGFTTELEEKKQGLRPPIKNEWKTGLKNTRGTIAMARTGEPDSATAQFFINVVDNAMLDQASPRGGNAAYCAFGKVVEGLEVLDKIRDTAVQVHPKYQTPDGAVTPVEPVIIKAVTLAGPYDKAKVEARLKEATEAAGKAKEQVVKEIKDLMDNLQGADGKKAVKTESGLIYLVMKEGTGATPKPTDRVEIHYTGRKPDGTVFDSSVERGKTMVHPTNGFVPGFTEALQLMKVGGKCRVVIPGKLAYGEGEGQTPMGQPKGTLVFDLELLAIK